MQQKYFNERETRTKRKQLRLKDKPNKNQLLSAHYTNTKGKRVPNGIE